MEKRQDNNVEEISVVEASTAVVIVTSRDIIGRNIISAMGSSG